MTTGAGPRHAAPRNSRPYPARHRKPNRRPQATASPFYPATPAEIGTVDYLTHLGGPHAIY